MFFFVHVIFSEINISVQYNKPYIYIIFTCIYTHTHAHTVFKIFFKLQHSISNGGGDMGYVLCALTPLLKGQRRHFSFFFSFLRKSGSKKWLWINIAGIWGEFGESTGTVLTTLSSVAFVCILIIVFWPRCSFFHQFLQISSRYCSIIDCCGLKVFWFESIHMQKSSFSRAQK